MSREAKSHATDCPSSAKLKQRVHFSHRIEVQKLSELENPEGKFSVIHGVFLTPGLHHEIRYEADVLKAGYPTFNMGFADINHSDNVLDRYGWTDNVEFTGNDGASRIEGDLIVPHIDKNKDLLDMLHTTYKGKSLLGPLSVEMYVEVEKDENGAYRATSIQGLGVSFVKEGEDPNAQAMHVLHSANWEAKNKMSGEIQAPAPASSPDSVMTGMMEELKKLREDNAKLVSTAQSHELAEKERTEKKKNELCSKVVELDKSFDAKILSTMTVEQLEHIVKRLGSVSAEPAGKTQPSEGVMTSRKSLNFERGDKPGLINFSKSNPLFEKVPGAGGSGFKVRSE